MYGRRILMHMKTLNRTLLLNKRQLDFESERDKVLMRDESMRLEDDNGLDEYDETVRSIFEFAKTMYIEEWKQVALVLDRFGVYFGFVLTERSIDKYRIQRQHLTLLKKYYLNRNLTFTVSQPKLTTDSFVLLLIYQNL